MGGMIDRLFRRTLLVIIMSVFCGIVFHAPMSVWLGTVAPDYQLAIKSWKEILIVLAAVIVAVQVSRHKLWGELSRDLVIRLSVAFALLHVVLLPFMWQGMLPAVAGLMINLRFIVFFMVVYAALKMYPQWRRPMLWGGFITASVAMLFVLLQVMVLPNDILRHIGYSDQTIAPYLTVDQNSDFVRINGTLRGPNPLGIYGVIIAAACLSLLVVARKKLASWRPFGDVWDVMAVGIVALIAVWFSYSRSALIALVIAIGVVLIARYGKSISKATWFAVGTSVLLLAGGLYIVKDTHFVSVVILHEDPNEGNNVNSNDGHWTSLIDGTERMIRQPLGAGIGSTGSPSLLGEKPVIIENYFLYVAHEVGWLGLALFVALVGVVLKRLWQRRSDWLALGVCASGIGVAVASLLLPVWADDTVSIVWWALAAVALVTPIAVKGGARRGRTI